VRSGLVESEVFEGVFQSLENPMLREVPMSDLV